MSNYHVRVIPMAGSSVGDNVVLVVTVVINDALDASPRVLDVIKVAPQIAVLDDRGKVWLWRKCVWSS
jgi:hypothetical protein